MPLGLVKGNGSWSSVSTWNKNCLGWGTLPMPLTQGKYKSTRELGEWSTATKALHQLKTTTILIVHSLTTYEKQHTIHYCNCSRVQLIITSPHQQIAVVAEFGFCHLEWQEPCFPYSKQKQWGSHSDLKSWRSPFSKNWTPKEHYKRDALFRVLLLWSCFLPEMQIASAIKSCLV